VIERRRRQMGEEGTIRADQIVGLKDMVRGEVRDALRAEAGTSLQDVDEVRRSPAGTLIRLEGKIDAQGVRTDAVGQRLQAVEEKIDQRFDSMERRVSMLQWVIVMGFTLWIAMAGKLFLGG
jgi:hypothetical protein